ncbi:MAG: PilZ domain-containing protein [Desulforhopalus sp.]
MNKRRHQRIEMQNLVARLSDGVETFSGTVSDVSRDGMLLVNIPEELNMQGEELSIVVSAKDKDFTMLVVPKWVREDNSEKKMGLIILDTPLDWTLFVMNSEPKDEDIWAATTHLPDC